MQQATRKTPEMFSPTTNMIEDHTSQNYFKRIYFFTLVIIFISSLNEKQNKKWRKKKQLHKLARATCHLKEGFMVPELSAGH